MQKWMVILLCLVFVACDSGEPCPDRQPFEADPQRSGLWRLYDAENSFTFVPIDVVADSSYYEGRYHYLLGESVRVEAYLTNESVYFPRDYRDTLFLRAEITQRYREASCQIEQTRHLRWEPADQAVATDWQEVVTVSGSVETP